MDINLFNTKRAQFLKKALNVYLKRHKAIAQNVAQANDVNYKRVNTDFSRELKGAMGQSKIKVTNAKHISQGRFDPVSREQGQQTDQSVDLTQEMTDLAENQIRYEFVTRMLRGYYSGLRQSISGRSS